MTARPEQTTPLLPHFDSAAGVLDDLLVRDAVQRGTIMVDGEDYQFLLNCLLSAIPCL